MNAEGLPGRSAFSFRVCGGVGGDTTILLDRSGLS